MPPNSLPAYLDSTFALLRRVYPDGIPPESVAPLMKVLYEHLSDRNLVAVIKNNAAEPGEISLNCVYEATLLDEEEEAVSAVRNLLEGQGLKEWIAEE